MTRPHPSPSAQSSRRRQRTAHNRGTKKKTKKRTKTWNRKPWDEASGGWLAQDRSCAL